MESAAADERRISADSCPSRPSPLPEPADPIFPGSQKLSGASGFGGRQSVGRDVLLIAEQVCVRAGAERPRDII